MTPPPTELLAVAAAALERVAEPQRSALLAQLHEAHLVRETPGRDADLDVPASVPPVDLPYGPISPSPVVLDADGQLTGELLVFVTDGRISGIERPWYTDDAPSTWPAPTDLSFGD